MASAGSWAVLWVACLAASPRPLTALLRESATAAAASGTPRLSVVDWNAYDERDHDGPGTYSFGYEIEDAASANTQFRQEERLANGTVVGSYGLVEPDGNVRVVSYVADAGGYRARIENSLRKNENFPRASSSSPPQRRPPKRPTDRLLDADVDVVAATTPPPSPLTWALLALGEGGRRPALQEQRVRPASAAKQTGQRRRQMQQQPPQQQQPQQQQPATTMGGQQYSWQQLQRKPQQQQQLRQPQRQQPIQSQQQQPTQPQQQQPQQQQWGDGQAWYRSQGYLPGDTVLRYAQQDGVQDADVLSNQLGAADSAPSSALPSWSSAPIVVWPAPAAGQRYLLPPIPALDKLIYKRNTY